MAMSIGLIPGIILYFIFCIFLIYTFILNDASTSSLAHCFTITLPNYTLSLLRKLIGPKLTSKLEHYISNYLLVTIYLIIVLGSWSIMFTFGYSFIRKSNHVSNYHQYSGYCVFVLCMWSWNKVHTTNPGTITSKSIQKFDNYPYDNFLFIPNTICPTVGIRKLPRSKYDRFTKCHVPRFDHYCGWVHNTIGEENYRFFILFLTVHVGMCIYGTIITWTLFHGEIFDKDLYNAIFFNGHTGQEVKADKWIVGHYMIMRHFELSCVLILMAAMSIVLFLFLSFHLYMIANGMTTNEYYKWRQVKKWYKREKARYEKSLKEGRPQEKHQQAISSSSNLVAASGIRKELTDVDVGCVGPIPSTTNNHHDNNDQNQNLTKDNKSKEESNDNTNNNVVVITDPGPLPQNIYNIGIIENFKEVIFPRSLRKDALIRYANAKKNK